MILLNTYSGRGGLRVCQADADKNVPSFQPFRTSTEKPVTQTRINFSDNSLAAPLVDSERMAYVYFLVASQDNAVLTPSQNNDQGLTVYDRF